MVNEKQWTKQRSIEAAFYAEENPQSELLKLWNRNLLFYLLRHINESQTYQNEKTSRGNLRVPLREGPNTTSSNCLSISDFPLKLDFR